MENMVITASAGTGKTYRLSIEYIKLLLEDVNYNNILVTTFTRKATLEIKERIISQLFMLSKKNKSIIQSLNSLGVEHIDFRKVDYIYKKILFNKNKIHIYTIDKFITNIFNKFVVPYFNLYGYQMIDRDKNSFILEDVLENIIQSKKSFDELSKFLSTFLEKDVTNYLKWIAEFIENRWKFLLADTKKRVYRSSFDIERSFEIVLGNLERLIAAKKLSPGWEEYLKSDFQALATLKEKRDFLDKNFSMFLNYQGENGFWDGIKLKKNKDCLGEHYALTESYGKFKIILSSHIFNNRLIPLENDIFKFAEVIFKEYDKLKLSKKEFTYNDILVYTYKFIYQFEKHSAEVFDEVIDYKNAHILVDEFQDTSILQWSIVRLLAQNVKQFIAVGDEKQSIYRWRGGEKELFCNLNKIMACNESQLDYCYRSQQEIVKFVNKFFQKMQIVNQPVKYLKENNKGYVEFGLYEKRNVKQKLVDSILEKKMIPEKTAILARTNYDLEDIAVYLDELKIPYVKESSMSLINHRAVKSIYRLIRFIVRDELIDLITFLRSDLVNISSNNMKSVLKHRDDVLLFIDGDDKSIDLDEHIVDILYKIRKLKKMDCDIVKYIVSEFGVLNIFDNLNDVKNVNKFYELCGEYVDISSFVDYIEDNPQDESLKQVGLAQNNAITLMTIHKAKGLEFENVLVYWNFTSKAKYNRNKLHLHLEFNESFSEVVDFCFTSSEMSSVLKYYGKNYQRIEHEKEVNEEINNLYVALTRAKNNLLIFSNFEKNLKGIDFSGDDEYLYNVKNAILSTTDRDNLNSLLEKPYSSGVFEQSTELEKKFDRLNLTDFKKTVVKPIDIGDSLESNIVVNKSSAIEKINRGIITHYFMSHIISIEDVERAKILTLNKFIGVVNKDDLVRIINLAVDLIKKNSIFNVKNGKVYNEVNVYSGGKEYRVDKLIIDDVKREIEIVDYKTGRYDESQIDKYKKAVSQLYPNYKIQTKVIEI